MEDLNSKIESIKKKYPNTITEKNLKKLFDTFKVKLPTIEQEHTNIGEDNGNELNELKHELNESLKDINEHSEIDVDDDKQKNDRLKGQGEKIVTSIEEVQKEPTTEIKAPHKTSPKKNRTTDIALGALAVGEAIGTTIGTIKQKSEEKIEHLKKKGEEVVQNISQQQKKAKKNASTSKKERKNKDGKVETNKVIKAPTNSSKNKTTKKKNDIPPKTEPKVVTSSKVKMSKTELMEALQKAERFDMNTSHSKGMNLLVINKLICYLQDNNDPEIQERLNNEIIKLQTDRHKNTDKLYIYNPSYTNLQTLKYMYDTYKDGVKSSDGSREIVSENPNAAAYYLFLANNAATDSNFKGNQTVKEEIIREFENQKEDVCYRYFEFLKEKYKIDQLSGIERLKVEPDFMRELTQSQFLASKTEYLDIAISKEILSRVTNNADKREFLEKVQNAEKRINAGQILDSRTLKLIGDLYYDGLKDASNEDIIYQDKRKASKIYEQIISKKKDIASEDVYNNLIAIYSDDTSPLYDKKKTDQLTEIAVKNKIPIISKNKKGTKVEPSTYVCSDLHGEYPAYQAIIGQLKEKDKLYILGDVIDRGPDGIKILQDIMKRKEKGQVEFLIGNHELMMVQALILGDKTQEKNWTSKENSGEVTKKAFEKLSPADQKSIKEFLLDSYVYKNIDVDSQKVHFVHAKAVQDEKDNSNKTVREMLAEGKEKLMETAVWSRGVNSLMSSEPHPESAKKGTFTVIGHSPTDNNLIKYKNGYLNIDCGAGNGAIASLVNLTKGFVRYFNVNRERTKINNKQKEK